MGRRRGNHMEKSIGTIKALYRYPAKGEPAVQEEKLVLVKDMGILGDHHGKGGNRQIALLTLAEKRWMEQQEIKGFCFRKYKENILLDGCSLKECHPGDLLCIGEAVLEITEYAKSCYPDLCALAKNKEACLLEGSSAFAVVKKGGEIAGNDAVYRGNIGKSY